MGLTVKCMAGVQPQSSATLILKVKWEMESCLVTTDTLSSLTAKSQELVTNQTSWGVFLSLKCKCQEIRDSNSSQLAPYRGCNKCHILNLMFHSLSPIITYPIPIGRRSCPKGSSNCSINLRTQTSGTSETTTRSSLSSKCSPKTITLLLATLLINSASSRA